MHQMKKNNMINNKESQKTSPDSVYMKTRTRYKGASQVHLTVMATTILMVYMTTVTMHITWWPSPELIILFHFYFINDWSVGL